jgi:DMSO reductase anchor subunit
MIQTLPLVLSIVMSELAIGSFLLLYVLDWRSEVRRSFLLFFTIIYLLFTTLTYLFQQSFASQPLLDSFERLDKQWTGYASPVLLAFLLLLLPYLLFLILDRRAGVDGKEKAAQAGEGQFSVIRVLRLVSGGLASVAGLLMLFVLGMIYRPLAPSPLGEALTVLSFFIAALAVGGVMTSMWLGHWYLVTPALSERPLLFSTAVVLIAIVLQILLTLVSSTVASPATSTAATHSAQATATTIATSPTPAPAVSSAPAAVKPAGAPTVSPLSMDVLGWLRILLGFAFPLVLGALTWKLARERSFQSATGMLYLIVVMTLAGEVLARGMFLSTL